MANKKIPISFNPAEVELEKRVDEMMEPVRSKAKSEPISGDTAPIDIFNDPKTAPQVPDGLLKKLKVNIPKAESDSESASLPARKAKTISVMDHDEVIDSTDQSTKVDIVDDAAMESSESDVLTEAVELPEADLSSGASLPSAPELPKDIEINELEESDEDEADSPADEPEELNEAEPETETKTDDGTPEPKAESDSETEDDSDEATEEEFAPVFTPEPPVVVPQLVKNPSSAIRPRRIIEPATGPVVNDIMVPPLKIDDARTDAAVSDIAAKEGDELLAAQDAILKLKTKAAAKKASKPRRKLNKLWVLIALIVVALAAVFILPTSRYKVAGLVVKKDLQVKVVDSKTMTPVSKAVVMIDGQKLVTNGSGVAAVRVGVGEHDVTITKQYYAATSTRTFMDFTDDGRLSVNLVAIGRQVPITVLDKLTDKPVVGAEISVLNTNAKTDRKGKAIIVLPTKTATVAGKISGANFNTSKIEVEVTDREVDANTYKLTPTGKVYFLSNEQGTIDVVKSNLDGTDRKTVIKGTGKEDGNTTVLLASRDWRYIVLKAQRTSTQASLFLIDGSTDKLTEFDSGDANFTPIGWSGHNFIYDVVRNTVATSQNGHEQIKSYDAERGQLNQLDQTQAEGDGSSYSYQGFYNFYILDNLLVYNAQWYNSGGADLSNKNDTIRGVQVTGANKKDYQNIAAKGLGYIQSALAKPNEIYYSAYNYLDNKTMFYEFKDGAAKESTTVNQASFNKVYPAYLASPNGQQVVWSEVRDGKPVVLLGDANAGGSKILNNLAGYNVYGWYSPNYLLVSKNNSELYIVSTTGSMEPLQLTDYYKPSQNQGSYSFGYGGL